MNLVIAQKCPYCTRWRNPQEIARLGPGGAVICWHCLEWHDKARMALCGHPPPGCQECGVSFAQLAERAQVDIPMYIHVKDGIYQVLCPRCSDKFMVANRVFWKGTRFADRLNLA